MAKNNSYLARQQAYMERRVRSERHLARVFELDLVTIALGRMGWREKKFKQFDEMMYQVSLEYCKDIIEDSRMDKDIWYSKDILDREIKQYVGELFVPYDERYKE